MIIIILVFRGIFEVIYSIALIFLIWIIMEKKKPQTKQLLVVNTEASVKFIKQQKSFTSRGWTQPFPFASVCLSAASAKAFRSRQPRSSPEGPSCRPVRTALMDSFFNRISIWWDTYFILSSNWNLVFSQAFKNRNYKELVFIIQYSVRLKTWKNDHSLKVTAGTYSLVSELFRWKSMWVLWVWVTEWEYGMGESHHACQRGHVLVVCVH